MIVSVVSDGNVAGSLLEFLIAGVAIMVGGGPVLAGICALTMADRFERYGASTRDKIVALAMAFGVLFACSEVGLVLRLNNEEEGYVHERLTYRLVYQTVFQKAIARGYPPLDCQAIASSVAARVSAANYRVDEQLLVPDSSLFPGTLHWYSHREARAMVVEAVATANPEVFGRGLHAVQDYFEHFGQGYTWLPGRWGERSYTSRAQMDDMASVTEVTLAPPVGEDQRLKNSRRLGHVNTATAVAFVDRMLGHPSGYESPDHFDPADAWDQLMVDESRYWIAQFAAVYLDSIGRSDSAQKCRSADLSCSVCSLPDCVAVTSPAWRP
jgi:hypothetical protein